MHNVSGQQESNWDKRFKEVSEEWNQRLKKAMSPEIQKSRITQAELAEMMRKRYGEDASSNPNARGKRQFTQQDASNWLNVGASKTKNDGQQGETRGFPKMETAIMIADCLNVDVGYLLGETEQVTFDLEKAADYIGLEPSAIASMRDLTTEKNGSRGAMQEDFARVASRLINADGFFDLLTSFLDIEIASEQLMDILEAEVDEAELDSHINKQLDKAYELMTYRYEAFECFVALTQELWPILGRVNRHGVHSS